MKKRKTSYQKLKEENERLKNDIYHIVMEKDFIKSVETKMLWRLVFQFEETVWQ